MALRPTCGLVFAVCLLSGSCIETRRRVPPDLAPRRVEEARVLSVLDGGGNPIGVLRELRILDPEAGVRKFLVENPHGQWVGFIDHNGLVTRRGRLGDEVLANGVSLAEGARLLFGLERLPELVELGARGTPPAAGTDR